MPIHIHDESTLAALSAATRPEEVRAADGRALGQFIPAAALKMSFPELGISDEELERLGTDPNARWHTPEEVMARLREIDRCSQ
jgi:hypothetical protein